MDTVSPGGSPWDADPTDDLEPDGDELDGIREIDNETYFASGRVPRVVYASKSFPITQEQSRDYGLPARFIYKAFHNDDESELVLEGAEWLIKETPAGRYQIKLLVSREAGQVKSLWIQRVPGPGCGGRVKTLVSLDRESSASLIELIRNLDHIPADGEISVRVDDALVRDLFATPGSLVSVYRRDPERFRRLITDDVSARDLIAISHRRQQVKKFRNLLFDKDFFDREAGQYQREEDVWQKFFESNPWILGVSLTGQLVTKWGHDKLEQVVAGASIAGPGKRADALLRTAGRIRSMAFAEFKTHRTKLLEEKPYRPGCWAPSKHLAGGVSQVQITVDRAVEEIGGRIADLAADGTEVPGHFTYLIKPRSFLVIGMLQDFIGELGGHDPKRFHSFELYRRNLVQPEVITFDELLAKAEYLVEAADTAEEHWRD
jgi:Domain of unknown function (DUF4263)